MSEVSRSVARKRRLRYDDSEKVTRRDTKDRLDDAIEFPRNSPHETSIKKVVSHYAAIDEKGREKEDVECYYL